MKLTYQKSEYKKWLWEGTKIAYNFFDYWGFLGLYILVFSTSLVVMYELSLLGVFNSSNIIIQYLVSITFFLAVLYVLKIFIIQKIKYLGELK